MRWPGLGWGFWPRRMVSYLRISWYGQRDSPVRSLLCPRCLVASWAAAIDPIKIPHNRIPRTFQIYIIILACAKVAHRSSFPPTLGCQKLCANKAKTTARQNPSSIISIRFRAIANPTLTNQSVLLENPQKIQHSKFSDTLN